MDFKQIEAFAAVIKHNSFSKASEALYTSQSSISSYISGLEAELGCKLLVRSTKEIYPTKDGEAFFCHAKNLLAMRDEAVAVIRGEDYSSRGAIDILASATPSQYLLPDVINEFRKTYPNITFSIRQADSNYVLEHLADTQFDIGITGAKPNNTKYFSAPIQRLSLSVIASTDISIEKDIPLKKLMKLFFQYPIILQSPSSDTQRAAEELLAHFDIDMDSLNISASFGDSHSIVRAVSKGMGMAVVPTVSTEGYCKMGGIQAFTIDESIANASFYLTHRRNAVLPPIVKHFVQFLSGARD